MGCPDPLEQEDEWLKKFFLSTPHWHWKTVDSRLKAPVQRSRWSAKVTDEVDVGEVS